MIADHLKDTIKDEESKNDKVVYLPLAQGTRGYKLQPLSILPFYGQQTELRKS